MTAKNVAIVWAPNLLRCKSLEVGGVAALQGVGVQAVVTEYLIKYCELIFSDKLPHYTPVLAAVEATSTPKILSKNRPKSLAISTPTKLVSLEEARSRALTASNNIENQKYIEVGGGPDNLPQKYHTVIELPGKKGGSFKHKKSTPWKSIFSGKEKKKSLAEERKISTPSELHLLSSSHQPSVAAPALRPVRSAESLVPCLDVLNTADTEEQGQAANMLAESVETPHSEMDMLAPLETVTRAVSDYRRDSPKCHSRSSSHDSYFERKLAVQFKVDMESEAEPEVSPVHNIKVDSSLDISEIQMNFDLEENEMKIFSEDEAMMSTSVGSELSLPRSPLEEVAGVRNSPAPLIVTRGSNQRNESPLESPTKSRRLSFKEKFKKFTSPTMSRKQSETSKMVDSGVGFDSDSCSGSFENKSFEEGKKSKLKEKIVAALSPESLRKRSDTHENSPKKKKSSVSPSASPNIGSLIKRSKIEDDVSEMSSINLSPSIKFIDASSSYELGLGVSNETLEEHWSDGAVTVRENLQKEDDSQMMSSIIEADVHELSEEKAEAEESVGPISIIGAAFDANEAVDELDQQREERSLVEENNLLQVSELEKTRQHVNLDQGTETEETILREIQTFVQHSDVEETKLQEAVNHILGTEAEETIPHEPLSLVQEIEAQESKHQEPVNLEKETEDGEIRAHEPLELVQEIWAEETIYHEPLNLVQETEAEEIRPDGPVNLIVETESNETELRETQNFIQQTENEESILQEAENLSQESEAVLRSLPNSLSSHTSEETSSLSSVSYAGATVSENESFGVETTSPLSTNDEVVDSDGLKVEMLECVETLTSAATVQERDDDSHYTAMEIDDDKNMLINKQKDDDQVENELGIEDFAMETDMTIMSAEIPASNKLYVKSDNKTVFNDIHFGNFNYESDSDNSDSSESPIESNTSERSDCPPRETETSNQTSAHSSPTDPPHLLQTEARAQLRQLSLDLSPAQESVVMRSRPTSPARNRSVRSDFLSNFVIEEPQSPQTDIGRPPLPKTSPPKFTGIAKALSPQPYNKPIHFDAQTKLSRGKFSAPSSDNVRSPPSPAQYGADLSQEMESIMEEKTLGGSVGTADINRDVGEEISIMEEKSLEITERLRMPSLSPEPEVGSECVSLEPEVSRELMTSPMESGRRSTQGIPEVKSIY